MRSLKDLNFHPVDDSPYEKDQHVPFSLVAEACELIENTSGKDSQKAIKEIISNVFRTAIILKPSELTYIFHFFITKLGPEYLGLDTGVGPEMLMKAVKDVTGRDTSKL